MNAIEVSNLVFGYTAHPVLKGLDVTVPEGALCCLTGENGSGKSTLMKVLLGELKGYTGEVRLYGKPLAAYRDLTWIGYVPQANVMSKVAFPTTCREIVVQGLYRDFGPVKVPRRRHFAVADAALERMGLQQHARKPFNELSGGLQQRVMICRALVTDPKLLVLDEPTAGVDGHSKARFLQLLADERQKRHLTCLIVSHEHQLISSHLSLDATYKIEDGRIVNA
ncbi:ATP-binding cassette domain-containing protein [Berryella wangjianweii]|uniref:ATP-binding cassette domain-containing protein n=1 Tax=Berryella wangjianweii TaxID=2734634 RepID=A0A6M8J1X9_9ACTN|nr:ATP-binding cassette domain-containing protein [Berryella wangjianweii]QKF07101.1 ATP-binding cassette domain-containing protein [Berryella wangjianweii]